MIEPVRSGAALVAELTAPLPDGVGAAFWRLGQAGFAIRIENKLLVIDLYLSNHCEALLPRPFDHRRESRAPLDPAELTAVDIVLCTHDHPDHLDVPTLRSLSTASAGSTVVAPASSVSQLQQLDWPEDRIVGSRAGQRMVFGDVEIEAFAVAHEDWEVDPQHGNPYQGFVISGSGLTLAHVGDALARQESAAVLADAAPDVLFVPINGRSAQRAALGFAGNMSAAEAVEFAAAAKARSVVPMHYDMFAQNVDRGALAAFRLAAEAASLPVVVPALGERVWVEIAGIARR